MPLLPSGKTVQRASRAATAGYQRNARGTPSRKGACREPGQIEIGDIVLVKMPDGDQSASHGSAAAVDEEYIAVEVRAAVSGEQARWSVGVIGATPGSASLNVSAADVMSIRPAA